MSNNFKIKSIKYNLIMNVILKMSAFLFPFITFPYVSRVLGATGNGKVAFASSIIYYFTVLATLGIPTYGVKACAKYRDDFIKLSKVVKELLIISSLMMIISYILFFIALYFIPQLYEEKILMLINSCTIFLAVVGVEWFYQAIEQYDYITFRNITFKIISIVLMFLFVKTKNDYIVYGLITVIGTTGSNILNLIRLHRFVKFDKKCKLNLKIHIKPILTLFLLTAATMIYTSLDTTMIGFISGDEQVGYYNAAVKLKTILVSLVTALGTVLLPRLSYFLANDKEKEFFEMIKKSFNFVIFVSIPAVVFCVIEAKNCILFLAGNGYENSVLPMQFIIPSIIFIGLSNIIGIQILVPLGEEKKTVLSTIYGAIVNLILNVYLIPKFGASGAALATTIAEFVVLITQMLMVRQKLNKMIDLKNINKILSSGLISSIVLFFMQKYVVFDNIVLNLFGTAIVFYGIFLGILFLLKENIVIDSVNKMVNIVNKKY